MYTIILKLEVLSVMQKVQKFRLEVKWKSPFRFFGTRLRAVSLFSSVNHARVSRVLFDELRKKRDCS